MRIKRMRRNNELAHMNTRTGYDGITSLELITFDMHKHTEEAHIGSIGPSVHLLASINSLHDHLFKPQTITRNILQATRLWADLAI